MENDGRLWIGIDRAFARKFYTDVPLSKIAHETGETIYLEKALIWILFLSVPITFIATLVFAVLAFQWWAFLIIPICAATWLFYTSESTRGNSKGWLISFILAIAIIVALTRIVDFYLALFFVAIALMLWATRILYLLSTFLLRCFVLRNVRAFSFLRNDIIIKTI